MPASLKEAITSLLVLLILLFKDSIVFTYFVKLCLSLFRSFSKCGSVVKSSILTNHWYIQTTEVPQFSASFVKDSNRVSKSATLLILSKNRLSRTHSLISQKILKACLFLSRQSFHVSCLYFTSYTGISFIYSSQSFFSMRSQLYLNIHSVSGTPNIKPRFSSFIFQHCYPCMVFSANTSNKTLSQGALSTIYTYSSYPTFHRKRYPLFIKSLQ